MTGTRAVLTLVIVFTLFAGVAAAAEVNINITPPPLIVEKPAWS